jgi:hypothetical protein
MMSDNYARARVLDAWLKDGLVGDRECDKRGFVDRWTMSIYNDGRHSGADNASCSFMFAYPLF